MKTILQINYKNNNYKVTVESIIVQDNGLGCKYRRSSTFKSKKYVLWCNGVDICQTGFISNETELINLINYVG